MVCMGLGWIVTAFQRFVNICYFYFKSIWQSIQPHSHCTNVHSQNEYYDCRIQPIKPGAHCVSQCRNANVKPLHLNIVHCCCLYYSFFAPILFCYRKLLKRNSLRHPIEDYTYNTWHIIACICIPNYSTDYRFRAHLASYEK